MALEPDIVGAISNSVRQASTQALDISFNELLDMSESGELQITPDYQRLFRWTDGQQSRFIESLLLEMPVPPIFVIEEEANTYQLIDGLQRISSYLHLRGNLVAEHRDPPITLGDKLRLVDCDIVQQLNGLTFEDLPASLQIRLKRRFIRMEVIRKETNSVFKYHMFKRLNTGGDQLSSQQVRNAAMRMLDSRFPNFIIQMSQSDSFKLCTENLTQERRLSAFDQELVLRFFALKNRIGHFKHDVTDFLDEYMQDVVDPQRPESFDYAAEESCFTKTFEALSRSIGEYAFAQANRRGTDFNLGFSIYHFEAISIGIQRVVARLDINNTSEMAKLGQTLRSVKLDPEFIAITTGGGKNSPGPLARRIGFVADRLDHAFP
jgi:hypothetical protein